MSLVGTYMLTH